MLGGNANVRMRFDSNHDSNTAAVVWQLAKMFDLTETEKLQIKLHLSVGKLNIIRFV